MTGFLKVPKCNEIFIIQLLLKVISVSQAFYFKKFVCFLFPYDTIFFFYVAFYGTGLQAWI